MPHSDGDPPKPTRGAPPGSSPSSPHEKQLLRGALRRPDDPQDDRSNESHHHHCGGDDRHPRRGTQFIHDERDCQDPEGNHHPQGHGLGERVEHYCRTAARSSKDLRG